MEQGISDITLFNRIKQDDRLALNTVFTIYYQKLCRFACTCSLTHEQAEEVVADVFFTLWKHRDRLVIHSNVKAYLYKCVKHGALNLIKNQRPEVELTAAHEMVDELHPGCIFDYQELQQYVDTVVNRLPSRCRQIFVMSRFDGLKYKEISAVLGISERTIENQLVKALRIVRTAIAEYQNTGSYVDHKTVTQP